MQQGNKEALQWLNPKTLAKNHPLKLKLSDEDYNRLENRLTDDGLSIDKPKDMVIDVKSLFGKPLTEMLDVRMLFSCLTDADFLDTEAHFEGNIKGSLYRESGPALDVKKALHSLEHYMTTNIYGKNDANIIVRDARNALWEMIVKSATMESGLFTLTAPTGSGKTLAMLKFALEHAAVNNLRRVVLVVPFLSIIEQTALIYRSVFQEFPERYVLEHHSLAGLGNESTENDCENAGERARRLLAENWDAPIIITTNVQLLESLFSNRPSACRKLHNLMGSIIMFDEAQTLPQALAVPTLGALSHLSKAYHCSVVFATATQPAFDSLHDAVKVFVSAGWQPVEAVPDHARLYNALRRYEVQWPADDETKVEKAS
ncbi:MAG: DEAD/DEAH box helicase [Nitrospirae bacterium]|nr:DEAD/DEAH box helicase [Nitrospirota bacterium]